MTLFDDIDTADAPVNGMRAQVRRIRYESEDGAFQVVVVRDEAGLELPAVVRDAGLRVGEEVTLSGSFQYRRDELQLVAERVERAIPDQGGMAEYLASGAFKGIGKVLAARLVEHFGAELAEVVETAPLRLAEVRGVRPEVAADVGRRWEEMHGQNSAMVQLMAAGISRSMARRLFQRYGARCGTLLNEDPYRFALEVSGIGFKRADDIARGVGIGLSDPRRLRAALVHVAIDAGAQGHVCLPESTLVQRAAELCACDTSEMSPLLQQLFDERLLVADGTLLSSDGDEPALYARQMLDLECQAATLVGRTAQHVKPRTSLAAADIDDLARRSGVSFSPSQVRALQTVADQPIAVLTGGPGTGKTTIVRALLERAGALKQTVALCAPTGRAARRLAEASGQSAMTIHRMLGYDPRTDAFHHDADNPVTTDLIVVDEASMLDLALAAALLSALGAGTRLLLVGDVEQLPSVGAGDVLADIIRSERVPVSILTEVHRQAAQSRIISAAHAVRHGRIPDAPNADDDDYFGIRVNGPDRALEILDQLVFDRIPQRFGLNLPNDIQILVPMHAGSCGTEAINRLVQTRIQTGRPSAGLVHRHSAFHVGDRVMQTRNNYDLDVFNGDIGVVSDVNTESRSLRVVFDERWVEFSGDALDDLDLAYAITIHKAQGSEFPAVVTLLTTQHFRMLQRNLVYTAMTRARQLLVSVHMPRALELAVANAGGDHKRFSRLAQRIRDEVPTDRDQR